MFCDSVILPNQFLTKGGLNAHGTIRKIIEKEDFHVKKNKKSPVVYSAVHHHVQLHGSHHQRHGFL
jgi:hypothetical protein